MKYLSLVLLFTILFSCKKNETIIVQSPDGNVKVMFADSPNSQISYSVLYKNEPVILPSKMEFEIYGETELGKKMVIDFVEYSGGDKTWKPVYGERSVIRDNYKQLKILLKEVQEPNRKMALIFKVYNEGVAYNYTFFKKEGQDSMTILSENTEFNFSDNYDCWASERAQSEIGLRKLNDLKEPVERPLLIKTKNCFVALGEAKLTDFARMKLIAGKAENSTKTALHGEVKVSLPYTTPWRTIQIGETPGKLLETNFFFENLNDDCAIEDVSWIKPGKVIREVTLTTQGGMACVDFAVKNGLQFVEFDAGWYGPENDENADASTISVDPKRSPGPLDLHKVIEYAKSKNIGIIVYVNRRALEKQIDEILPLYKSWGIAGVKYGFVQVGSQKWTAWLHEAVKKAANNKLMVDIHDEYRPTGFSRTYPNLMTQEGIRGDEESPSNEHTLKTLFTRMLAGAGDNTICYYAPRVQEKMGGNVSQLAKAVMLYSPWQFLYWYDRPQGSPGKKGGAGSSQGFIQNHPELDFFKNMPTVWDETKVLEGEIGKYATIIRRTGEDWFLGSLTGNASRKLEFTSNFLSDKNNYEAKIYGYNPESESATKVEITTLEVNSASELDFNIEKNSGLAIHFVKL